MPVLTLRPSSLLTLRLVRYTLSLAFIPRDHYSGSTKGGSTTTVRGLFARVAGPPF